MHVNLIDYTGAGSPDPLYAARLLVYTKATRLPQGEATRAQIDEMSEREIIKQLDYMSNTIRSSWEFVDYVFEIHDSPVATNRQMQRSRVGVSFAEQSMRVTDMRNFGTHIPDTIVKKGMGNKWEHLMRLIALAYREFSDAGVPAEDARGALPMNTFAPMIAKYNLRSFAEMAGKRKSLRAQGMYRDVVDAMETAIYKVHPWAHMFIAPDRSKTPFLDAMFEKGLDGGSLADHPEVAGAVKERDNLLGNY